MQTHFSEWTGITTTQDVFTILADLTRLFFSLSPQGTWETIPNLPLSGNTSERWQWCATPSSSPITAASQTPWSPSPRQWAQTLSQLGRPCKACLVRVLQRMLVLELLRTCWTSRSCRRWTPMESSSMLTECRRGEKALLSSCEWWGKTRGIYQLSVNFV